MNCCPRCSDARIRVASECLRTDGSTWRRWRCHACDHKWSTRLAVSGVAVAIGTGGGRPVDPQPRFGDVSVRRTNPVVAGDVARGRVLARARLRADFGPVGVLLLDGAAEFDRRRRAGEFDELCAQLRASMGADAASECGLDGFTSVHE